MAAAAAGAGAGTPGQIEGPAHLPHSLALLALLQVVGGTSPFPVVPWAAYFFAGTVVGLLAPADRRGALAIGAVGLALTAFALQFPGLGVRPAGDPVLIAFRIGAVLVALAALGAIPAALARHTAPLGKSSLGVYAIHLPIVYGWSHIAGLSWRVGPTLGAPAAVGVAFLVLLVSFVAYRVLAAGTRLAAARWALLRRLWRTA